MGRDMTPREKYCAYNQYGDLFKGNVTITSSDGKISKLFSDEEMKLREKYPRFAILFTDYGHLNEVIGNRVSNIDEVYKKLEEFSTEIEKLDDFDDDLEDYCYHLPTEFVEWYMGKLDEAFYYSIVNDRLFVDWVSNNIQEILGYNII